MPAFDFTVYESDQVREGTLAGATADEVIGQLQARGYIVVALAERREESWLERFGLDLLLPGKSVDLRHLIAFARRLAIMLQGGLPLLRALSNLSRGNHPLAASLGALRVEIAAGLSLSAAMAKQPAVYPALLRGLLSAGESSGAVVPVLKRYAEFMERQEEFRRKVLGALLYPAILLAVAAALLVFMSVRVVPTFAKIFEAVHLQLPFATVVVIAASDFLIANAVTLVSGLLASGILLRVHLRSAEGHRDLCRLELRLPWFNKLFIGVWHERLWSTLSMLISCGVSVVQSLVVLEEVFSENPVYVAGLRETRKHICSGASIAASFRKAGFVSEDDLESVASAEEVGCVAESMELLGRTHGEDVDYLARQLSTVIEPVMIVAMGAVVGFIMLGLLLPMAELANIRPGG